MNKTTTILGGLAIAATLALTGCTSSNTGSTNTTDNTNQTQSASSPWADATVIDVRTPAEYAQGHVPGAVNIDISSPQFSEQIDQLAAEKGTDTNFVVYCRSGNRSGQATQILQSKNLNVENAGGLADVQAAGVTLTTN